MLKGLFHAVSQGFLKLRCAQAIVLVKRLVAYLWAAGGGKHPFWTDCCWGYRVGNVSL